MAKNPSVPQPGGVGFVDAREAETVQSGIEEAERGPTC